MHNNCITAKHSEQEKCEILKFKNSLRQNIFQHQKSYFATFMD